MKTTVNMAQALTKGFEPSEKLTEMAATLAKAQTNHFSQVVTLANQPTIDALRSAISTLQVPDVKKLLGPQLEATTLHTALKNTQAMSITSGSRYQETLRALVPAANWTVPDRLGAELAAAVNSTHLLERLAPLHEQFAHAIDELSPDWIDTLQNSAWRDLCRDAANRLRSAVPDAEEIDDLIEAETDGSEDVTAVAVLVMACVAILWAKVSDDAPEFTMRALNTLGEHLGSAWQLGATGLDAAGERLPDPRLLEWILTLRALYNWLQEQQDRRRPGPGGC